MTKVLGGAAGTKGSVLGDFDTMFQSYAHGAYNKMYLYARSRIQLNCNSTCNAFEPKSMLSAANELEALLTEIWEVVKAFAYCVGILSTLGLCYLLYVIR